MKKNAVASVVLLLGLLLIISVSDSFAQYNFKNSETFQYQKNEIDWGLHYYSGSEREEIRTDTWGEFEELTTGAVKFQFRNQFWKFLEYKQERFDFNVEAGPIWGNGNWGDSSLVANVEAKHRIFGLRTNALASYASRYYYNNKNYTLVKINGWARYDLYNQTSKGISTDSNDVVKGFRETTNEDKFRYGIDVRAGWVNGKIKTLYTFICCRVYFKNLLH